MRLSSGKRKRLEAVSDSRGVIAALAIDQRDALRSLFSAESKIEKKVVEVLNEDFTKSFNR